MTALEPVTGRRTTVRWTEDQERYSAQTGRQRLEVFPLFGGWAWRRFTIHQMGWWKVREGGMAATQDDAMTAAAMSLR